MPEKSAAPSTSAFIISSPLRDVLGYGQVRPRLLPEQRGSRVHALREVIPLIECFKEEIERSGIDDVYCVRVM